MKTIVKLSMLVLLALVTVTNAQTSSNSLTALPGDNLNLQAVLHLFKSSSSVQNFETQLNDQSNKLNNLDLNKDGKVDYLRVHEKSKRKNHLLIIQAVLGENDIQDVAVINITKKGDQVAQVQIIGDEALYGKNYIIEPSVSPEASVDSLALNNSSTTPSQNPDANAMQAQTAVTNNVTNNNYYGTSMGTCNAWYWPTVNLMFAPAYVCWRSPYFWGYYPIWWNAYSPMMGGMYMSCWINRPFYRSYCRTTVICGRGYHGYMRYGRTCSPMCRNNYGYHQNAYNGHRFANMNGNGARANWGGYNRMMSSQAMHNNGGYRRANYGGHVAASGARQNGSFDHQRGNFNRNVSGSTTRMHFNGGFNGGGNATRMGGGNFHGGSERAGSYGGGFHGASNGGGFRGGSYGGGGHGGSFGGGHGRH